MEGQQKITPFLWFDREAEEAAKFYTSVFKNSRITSVTRYTDAGPGKSGTVMTVEFELDGQKFVALNGGPVFRFNEAVSFVVNCSSQGEVDEMWARLTEGGSEGQCGWLKDRFGLSWQVVPKGFVEVLTGREPGGSKRAMEAMQGMRKLDLASLKRAYEGK